MIRDEPERIRNTMSLYQKIDQYKRDVNTAFSNESISNAEKKNAAYSLLDSMTAALEEVQSKGAILGSHGDSFQRQIREHVFQNTYALERSVASEKQSLDSVIAKAKQDTAREGLTLENPSEQRPLPERT